MYYIPSVKFIKDKWMDKFTLHKKSQFKDGFNLHFLPIFFIYTSFQLWRLSKKTVILWIILIFDGKKIFWSLKSVYITVKQKLLISTVTNFNLSLNEVIFMKWEETLCRTLSLGQRKGNVQQSEESERLHNTIKCIINPGNNERNE